MKRILSVLLFITFSTFSYGQTAELYSTPWKFRLDFDLNSESKRAVREREILKKNNVRSREQIRYKNGVPYKTVEGFDEEGRLVIVKRNNVKRELSITTFSYNESGDLGRRVFTDNKGKLRGTDYTYDEEGRLLSQITNDSKKGYSASTQGYNDEGKLEFRRIYIKDKENPVRELTYDYHENGDMKTTNYFVKGKLKYSWKYDCKPEGELINVKRKDETMLCLSEDIDDNGNKIVWERKFDEKGKLTKLKTVYFSDSLVLLKQRYDGSDRLIFEMNVIYNEEKTKRIGNKVYLFHKNEERYLASETAYSKERGSQTHSYDKKGNVTRTSSYLSNEDGRPLKTQTLNKRWRYTYLYNYGENGLKRSEVIIYKKRTHVREYVYDYYVN